MINFNTKKLNFLLPILTVFFIINKIHAQQTIKAGYLVSNNGDTIKGFIPVRNWDYTPSSIELRKEKNKAGKLFSYKEIKEFRTDKEWFIVAAFDVELSPRTDNNINYDSNYILKTDTGFLQVLVKGSKSLFYYRKKNSEANLYIEENNQPKLLKYKRYIKNTDFNIVTGELKDYKKQLVQYLTPCADLITQIEQINYSELSLFAIFQKYYKNCADKNPLFVRQADKLKFEFGINAGVQFTKLNFKPSSTGRQNFGQLVLYNHPAYFSFTGSAFMNMVFQRGSGRTSLYNELNYGSFGSVWKTRVNGFSSSIYSDYDCKLILGYIKLSNMLQYKTNTNVSFVLKAGVATSINFEQSNTQKRDDYFGSNVGTTYGKVLERTRKWDIAPVAGIGTAYKRYSFELRYERNRGLSDYLATGSRSQRVMLLAGVTLQ